MSDHKIGTREQWQAARDDLAKRQAEHAELERKLTEQRRQLPWVRVETEYRPTTSSVRARGARTWVTSSTPPASI